MNIGDKIKTIRKSRGLTQEELAQECGISKNGLWNYENGKRDPSLNILNKISSVLNVSLFDLVEEENQITYDKKEDGYVDNETLTQVGIADSFYTIWEKCSKILKKEYLMDDKYMLDILELSNNISDMIMNKIKKIDSEINESNYTNKEGE